MKKYLLMQLKRASRYLLWGLCVVAVLFGCLTLVYKAMVNAEEADAAAEAQKLKLGVVGTTQDQYLQWMLAAMQFDSTALSLEMVPMEEAAAKDALVKGEIMAYFIFPENFLEDAMYGDVQKLRFISNSGAAGLVSILKNEITRIADDILVACESGTYGVGDALDQNGSSETYGEHVDALAWEYVDFLFDRAKMYRVEEVPQNALSLDQYMLGGLTVVLLMLSCLPFAPLYIRADQSLFRVLRARRVGLAAQTFAEFLAYFGAMMALLATVAAILHFGNMLPEGNSGLRVFVGCLPAVLMMASLTYCMYALSDHLISGVLLAFVAILALCFIGGCLYQIQMFPVSIQQAAKILPSGIARESVTGALLDTGVTGIWPLLGYSALFLGVATGARYLRAGKVRG